LFSAGFATFTLINCVQPLLPVFAATFHVSPALSSLSLSLTTGVMGFALLLASFVSDSVGRKSLMVASLTTASLLVLASAFAPSFALLLTLRIFVGLAISGIPAVAMAYLHEEMDRQAIGLAMGLYIGGSAIGGMAGRLLTGVISDLSSWRGAVAAMGLIGLASSAVFAKSLPRSRHFSAAALDPRSVWASFGGRLRDLKLGGLYAMGFLLMGAFVASYNYMSFRLLGPPFGLSQSLVGVVFAVYLVGLPSSAWLGHLAGVLGPGRVLPFAIALVVIGALIGLANNIYATIGGLAVETFGFFGAHSIASAWVGATARDAKAQASALYLFFYYLGGSAIGTGAGLAWSRWAWTGVGLLVALLAFLALLISLALAVAARPLADGPLDRTIGPGDMPA
jgi:YNFM family putative membrane transporter